MLTATLGALVCAACRPGPPPAPAPPETVRFTPATARYRLVEHRHVEQHYHDQPIVTDAVTSTVLTVTIDSAATGFLMRTVVDSLAVAGDAGILPDAAAAAASARFEARVSPQGTLGPVTAPPEDNALFDQLALRMHELLPSLPTGGAAPGGVWHDTTRAAGRTAGLPITLVAHGRHHAADGWIDHDGHPVLPIYTAAAYELSGEGERAGQWVSMTGTGTSHLRRLVTRDGLVALGVRSDTLRVTIELPASGLRIPLTQVRSDTLRRLD